jgi:hypothetical protein
MRNNHVTPTTKLPVLARPPDMPEDAFEAWNEARLKIGEVFNDLCERYPHGVEYWASALAAMGIGACIAHRVEIKVEGLGEVAWRGRIQVPQ